MNDIYLHGEKVLELIRMHMAYYMYNGGWVHSTAFTQEMPVDPREPLPHRCFFLECPENNPLIGKIGPGSITCPTCKKLFRQVRGGRR